MKEQFANEETRVGGGMSALVWVLALSGILGASAVCFVCSLFLETFAAHFYTSLIAGGAAGIVLAAVILAVTGKMKTLGSGSSAKTVIVLAALAVFFMAGSAFMIAEKDTKAPIIAFSDETVTMREGDPESGLSIPGTGKPRMSPMPRQTLPATERRPPSASMWKASPGRNNKILN